MMNKLKLVKQLALILTIGVSVIACGNSAAQDKNKTYPKPDKNNKVIKTDKEWKQLLTDEEYKVLREQGTERAFSGDLHDNHKAGTYICAGCGIDLFSSEHKFESGTGWPSFWQPINEANVEETMDKSHGMTRSEIHCARCGGHLGHVFEDGPKPTGLRYCINSVSMDFRAKANSNTKQ